MNVLLSVELVSNNEGKAVAVQATTPSGKQAFARAALSHEVITSQHLLSTMVDKQLKFQAIAAVVEQLVNEGDL